MSFAEVCVVPTVTIDTPHIRLLMRYMTHPDKTKLLNDWMRSSEFYNEYIIPQYCRFKGFVVAEFMNNRSQADILSEISELPYRMGMFIITERNGSSVTLRSVEPIIPRPEVIICNVEIPLPPIIYNLIISLALDNYMHMEPEFRAQTLIIFDLYLYRPSRTDQVSFHKDSGQNRHGDTPRIPEIGSENVDFVSLLYLADTDAAFRGATFIVDDLHVVRNANQLSLAVMAGTTVMFRDYAFYHGTPQSVIPTDKESTPIFAHGLNLIHEAPAMSNHIKGLQIEHEINNPPQRRFLRMHFVINPMQEYKPIGDPITLIYDPVVITHNSHIRVNVENAGQLNAVLDAKRGPLQLYSVGGTKMRKSNRKIRNKTRKIGGNHVRNIDVCCKTSDYYAFAKQNSGLTLNLEGL